VSKEEVEMKSRREFLGLVAAGSAAATLGRAGRALAATSAKSGKGAAAKPATSSGGKPARSAAIEAELDKQKKSTADLLKTIRGRELDATTPLAFAFKPLRRGKGGRAS
jgi:hypothetical protein